MKYRFVLNLFAYLLVATVLTAAVAAGCGESSSTLEPVQQADSPDTGKAGVLPPTATPVPPGSENSLIGQPAPFLLEDLGLVGLDGWINSEPLEIDELTASGEVVLIDFWTYTCVNCIRTFPYLSAWHDLYSDYGLTVIGVHSPEFDFEKIPANVRAAVDRYEIEYPVALDGNKRTWDKYGSHFWPSKYLVSASGEVVFRHFGEGGYAETESLIRNELELAGNDLVSVPRSIVVGPERSEGAHSVTRELYGGYANNYLSDGLYAGQDAYYAEPDAVVDYVDDGTRRHGQFFLNGEWVNGELSIDSGDGGEGEGNSNYFAFDFFATSVNAVLGTDQANRDETEVVVELDDRPLSREEAGPDITWNDSGESVMQIRETRLYQMVELPEFGKHELKLKTNSEGLAIFTVTFGVFDFGP